MVTAKMIQPRATINRYPNAKCGETHSICSVGPNISDSIGRLAKNHWRTTIWIWAPRTIRHFSRANVMRAKQNTNWCKRRGANEIQWFASKPHTMPSKSALIVHLPTFCWPRRRRWPLRMLRKYCGTRYAWPKQITGRERHSGYLPSLNFIQITMIK